MALNYQFITAIAVVYLSFASLNKNKYQVTESKVTIYQSFVNSIVSDKKCNSFGFEQHVQNSDVKSAYTVTVKVTSAKGEYQKIVSVPAGGKTYVGCSQSIEISGPTYTFTIIGESKQ